MEVFENCFQIKAKVYKFLQINAKVSEFFCKKILKILHLFWKYL